MKRKLFTILTLGLTLGTLIAQPIRASCNCNCHCDIYEQYSVYTPKVTIVHNANARLAYDNNQEVYYIPTMGDLPIDLGERVLSIESANGKTHKFALVYDGLYDAEAGAKANHTGSSKAIYDTWKSVSIGKYNDQAIQLIGPDILLRNETIKFIGSNAVYQATKQLENPLIGKTAVMDVYKALSVFEYRIKFNFLPNPSLDINTSPIANEIDFLTSKETYQGIDKSEAYTDVLASRTIPKLYMDRFDKDGVNTGIQQCDLDNMSTIYHMDVPISKDQNITMAQFANLTVALMNLYGAEAITDEEVEKWERYQGALLVGQNDMTDVERRAVEYLIIKGIIDPGTVNFIDWAEPAKLLPNSEDSEDYNYVLPWLGRVANKDSRLPMSNAEKPHTTLSELGYVSVDLNMSQVSNLMTRSKDDVVNTRDYLIEYQTIDAVGKAMPKPHRAYWCMMQNGIPDADGTSAIIDITNVDSYALENVDIDGEDAPIIDGDKKLFIDTANIQIAGLKAAKSLEEVAEEPDTYYYMGTEIHDGKNYYHLRVNRNSSFPCQVILSPDNDAEWIMELSNPKNKETHAVYECKPYLTESILVDTSKKEGSGNKHRSRYCQRICTIYKQGGVYPVEDYAINKFKDLNFSLDYIDDDMVASEYESLGLSSGDYITQFYCPMSYLTYYIMGADASGKERPQDDVFDWSVLNIQNPEEFIGHTNTLPVIADDSKHAYITVNYVNKLDGSAYKKEQWVKVEIVTNYKKAFAEPAEGKASILCPKNKRDVTLLYQSDAKEGYIRYSKSGSNEADAELMVSLKYLKSQEWGITGYEERDNSIFLSSTKYGTNVVIDKKLNLVFIGNVIYTPSGTGNSNTKSGVEKNKVFGENPLYVKQDNDIYVNYRACLGWCGELQFQQLRDTKEASLMATSYAMFDSKKYSAEMTTAPVNALAPKSVTRTLYSRYTSPGFTDDNAIEGINLQGSYALAPYALVHTDYGDYDYLFVWHLKNLKNTSGDRIKSRKKADEYARQLFADLTNRNLSDIDSDRYFLACYQLNKNEGLVKKTKESDNSLAELNPKGFKYVTWTLNTKQNGKKKTKKFGQRFTAGWTYEPCKVDSIKAGLNQYAKSIKYARLSNIDLQDLKDTNDNDLTDLSDKIVLPIVKFQDEFYDVNINVSHKEGSKYAFKPLGEIYVGEADDGGKSQMLALQADNSFALTNMSGGDTWVTQAAPVGFFTPFMDLGSDTVDNLKYVTLYFGGSKCYLKKKKLYINGVPMSLETSETKATCSYLSNGPSTIYCIVPEDSGFDSILKEANTVLSFALKDPEKLVDWSAYTYNALIANADAWSNVALIFVLNIIPRVAMLLFFLLMMLSLIKEVRPWQMICDNVFDVYSFLTFGHQTVHSIEMKPLFFHSLVGFILFGLILDGQLFNFMLFITKLIVEIYSR